MKVWIWAAAALMTLGAIGACGNGSGGASTGSMFTSSTGTGSSGVGGAGGTTFTTTGSASTSGAGGADCGAMPDHQTCLACEAGKHPTGAMLYKSLDDCVYCSECYTVCDGKGHGCAGPPAKMGACDSAAPDMTVCGNTCSPCANMGACKTEFNACIANQDCADYGTAILKCPKMP